jgi:hypothetical protein
MQNRRACQPFAANWPFWPTATVSMAAQLRRATNAAHLTRLDFPEVPVFNRLGIVQATRDGATGPRQAHSERPAMPGVPAGPGGPYRPHGRRARRTRGIRKSGPQCMPSAS